MPWRVYHGNPAELGPHYAVQAILWSWTGRRPEYNVRVVTKHNLFRHTRSVSRDRRWQTMLAWQPHKSGSSFAQVDAATVEELYDYIMECPIENENPVARHLKPED